MFNIYEKTCKSIVKDTTNVFKGILLKFKKAVHLEKGTQTHQLSSNQAKITMNSLLHCNWLIFYEDYSFYIFLKWEEVILTLSNKIEIIKYWHRLPRAGYMLINCVHKNVHKTNL